MPTSAHATCSERTPLARKMITNVWTAMAYQWMQTIFSQQTTIARRNETFHAPAYSIQASASPDAALALKGRIPSDSHTSTYHPSLTDLAQCKHPPLAPCPPGAT
jgi:hypothetical protein